jgi:hypothetical protein
MKTRRNISEGRTMEHAQGLGTVTDEMVLRRAYELAHINSRPDGKPTPSDWDQAKQELLGGHAAAAEEGDREIPAGKRWDPVPGSTGHRVVGQDIDDEQTVAERLVQEGIDEAEHELMVEGSKRTRADRDIDTV